MGQKGSAIAIDHGEKRTGFAVCDPLRIAVEPLDTWHGPGGSDELLDHIAELLRERAVTAFVVGIPCGADGSPSPSAARVQAFAARLAARFPGIDVVLRDERLTTREALDLLREAGHHGAARKARRDSWSALVLLREWLDSGEPR